MKQSIKTLVFIIFIHTMVFAQEYEKCGTLDSIRVHEELLLRGDHWGYGYQDLLNDLPKWEDNPFITIDSIGSSVQNRTLWELRISSDDINAGKHTIYMHVRTHPNEVQSFWVANEVIKFLVSEDSLAQIIRNRCVLYIVPMYNPDGVELEYARENANKIDLESNWYATLIQPEVKALRSRFVKLMGSDNPIELALNLHSAYKCKRYFVYHHQNGTSTKYSQIEKLFINYVVNYFTSGFQPWNFFVTWKNGTPKKYPESWWWLNFKEKVLALTYEDGNCEEAGDYNKTAYAIIAGIGDYFNINNPTSINEIKQNTFIISPNPVKFGEDIVLDFNLAAKQKVKIEVFDVKGQKLLTLFESEKNKELLQFKVNSLYFLPGLYIFKLTTKNKQIVKKIIVF